MEHNIKEIKHNNIRWLNIESPSRDDVEYLRNNFKLHPLDLEDVIAPTQRSKIDKYEDYLFIVLLFPVFNRKTRTIESSEVDIFLSDNFIITVHQGNIPPLVDLFQLCMSSEQAKENSFASSSQLTLYNILQKLFLYCYPILDHISIDLQNIKKEIFAGNEKQIVKQLLSIRRNITDMRKIMQSHQNTLQKLIKTSHQEEKLYLVNNKYHDYYDNLIDYSKEIWDQLESFKESIEALQETNESLISFKLNNVMKILTLISVVMLPATFIASLFGVNAASMPFAADPNGFWMMTAVAFFSAAIMIAFIWRKKWF